MTTINLTNIAPPTLSNLQVYNTIGGANLEWDLPALDTDVWSTEIWFSSTNDRSSATLVSEVKGTNTYFWQDTSGTAGYFWIRSKSTFGYNNGAWEPVSSTAGVALNIPYVASSDISTTSSYSSASTSSGSSLSAASITNWNTWYDQGYINFTVPASGTGFVNGNIAVAVSNSAITGAAGGEITNVQVRFRLYDNNTSSYVSGEESTYYILFGIANTTTGSIEIVNYNFKYSYGALGNLIPSHTYHIKVDVSKNRSGSAATMTTTVNTLTGNTLGTNIS